MMKHTPHRGFTLLIAVILSSVSLSLGLALLNVAYKQVTLALSAKQSAYAFANADTALECALYYDQKTDTFAYTASSATITCNTYQVTVTFTQSSSPRKREFSLPCDGGTGQSAAVTVYKANDSSTTIYSNGYNTCDSNDTRRVERGLRISY